MTLAPDEIGSLIDSMEKECNQIKSDSMKMSWFMRGGITYTDILNLSIAEREMINNIIDTNLETTKNTKMPFF